MLEFTNIDAHNPGLITSLLQRSYLEFYSQYPAFWQDEKAQFNAFDVLPFNNPKTVGKCVLFSSFCGQVVGLASFDPRKGPLKGVIGHNCILPDFRGKGFGKLQIHEVLRQLKLLDFKKAVVSTGNHPFFVPAQRMYLSCGFKEVHRNVAPSGSSKTPFKMIAYERDV